MTLQAIVKQIDHWMIDKLIPACPEIRARHFRKPRSPRIAASIVEFGFNNPILVDTKSGIIAGHGRLSGRAKARACRNSRHRVGSLLRSAEASLHHSRIETRSKCWMGRDPASGGAGRATGRGFDTSVLGFEDEELACLLAAQDATEGLTDEDAVPPLGFAFRSSGRRIRSRGDSAVTSYSMCPFLLHHVGNKGAMPGTAKNRNLRCGKRRSPRPTACTLP